MTLDISLVQPIVDTLINLFSEERYGVAGKRNDTTYLNTIENNIEPGSLHIKDLGFWSISHFGKIHQAGAYLLTRYKVPNNVYCKVGGVLTVLNLQEALKGIEQPTVIENLFLDADKIPVRLHVEKVPDEVAEKRRAKLRKKAASNKAISSELSLFLCQFTIKTLPIRRGNKDWV